MSDTVEPVSTVNDCAIFFGLYIEVRGHGHPGKAARFRCKFKALKSVPSSHSDKCYDLLCEI